jgi:hypothetical protein
MQISWVAISSGLPSPAAIMAPLTIASSRTERRWFPSSSPSGTSLSGPVGWFLAHSIAAAANLGDDALRRSRQYPHKPKRGDAGSGSSPTRRAPQPSGRTEIFRRRVSGAQSSRPALDEMLADAKRGKFRVLLVWKLDRLGRSLAHLVRLGQSSVHIPTRFLGPDYRIDIPMIHGTIIPIASSATAIQSGGRPPFPIP